MEDSQFANIPLNSAIDVDSNDMLVSVDNPKLAHNRQDFQGSTLPNSIRYEHDGWFAGWHAHMFKFEQPDSLKTIPDGPYRYNVNKKPTYHTDVYLLSSRDGGPSFTWQPINKVVKNDGGNITFQPYTGHLAPVSGITADGGSSWQVTVDINDPSQYSHSEGFTVQSFTFDEKTFVFSLKIKDDSISFDDSVTLYRGHDTYLGNDLLQYSYEDGTHTWYGKGSYTLDSLNNFVFTDTVDMSSTVSNVAIGNNTVSFKYTAELSSSSNITYSYDNYPIDIDFDSLSVSKLTLSNTGTSGSIGAYVVDVSDYQIISVKDGTAHTYGVRNRVDLPVYSSYAFSAGKVTIKRKRPRQFISEADSQEDLVTGVTRNVVLPYSFDKDKCLAILQSINPSIFFTGPVAYVEYTDYIISVDTHISSIDNIIDANYSSIYTCFFGDQYQSSIKCHVAPQSHGIRFLFASTSPYFKIDMQALHQALYQAGCSFYIIPATRAYKCYDADGVDVTDQCSLKSELLIQTAENKVSFNNTRRYIYDYSTVVKPVYENLFFRRTTIYPEDVDNSSVVQTYPSSFRDVGITLPGIYTDYDTQTNSFIFKEPYIQFQVSHAGRVLNTVLCIPINNIPLEGFNLNYWIHFVYDVFSTTLFAQKDVNTDYTFSNLETHIVSNLTNPQASNAVFRDFNTTAKTFVDVSQRGAALVLTLYERTKNNRIYIAGTMDNIFYKYVTSTNIGSADVPMYAAYIDKTTKMSAQLHAREFESIIGLPAILCDNYLRDDNGIGISTGKPVFKVRAVFSVDSNGNAAFNGISSLKILSSDKVSGTGYTDYIELYNQPIDTLSQSTFTDPARYNIPVNRIVIHNHAYAIAAYYAIIDNQPNAAIFMSFNKQTLIDVSFKHDSSLSMLDDLNKAFDVKGVSTDEQDIIDPELYVETQPTSISIQTASSDVQVSYKLMTDYSVPIPQDVVIMQPDDVTEEISVSVPLFNATASAQYLSISNSSDNSVRMQDSNIIFTNKFKLNTVPRITSMELVQTTNYQHGLFPDAPSIGTISVSDYVRTMEDDVQAVSVAVGSYRYEFDYNLKDGTFAFLPDNPQNYGTLEYNYDAQYIIVPIVKPFEEDITLSFAKVIAISDYTLLSFSNDIGTIDYRNGKDTLTIDCNTHGARNVEDYNTLYDVSFTDEKVDFKFFAISTQDVQFMIEGMYNVSGIIQNEVTATSLKFNVGNDTYALIKDDIKDTRKFMHCVTQDIRNDTIEDNEEDLISIDTQAECQLIRQFWDTDISTENFWVVDANHVMQLTEKSFIMYEKDIEHVSDWNGNVWNTKPEWHWERSLILNSNVLHYTFTSSNGANCKLVTLTADADNVVISVYNPLADNKPMTVEHKYTVQIKNCKLGEPVNTKNAISTYLSLDAYALLSSAKITTTMLVDANSNEHFVIGIAIDKGINQWAISIGDNSSTVICGYGIVGHDGSLTGGEIPSKYFDVDNGGYTAIVEPIDKLKDFHTGSVTDAWSSNKDIVVGNASQQWYITASINSIISHCKFDVKHGAFTPIDLKINSNYAADYNSGSFYTNKIVSIYPTATTLSDMLPFKGAIKKTIDVLSRILSPSIWYYTPTWSKFAFLQQSIGQYAYVWYNNNIKQVDAELRNEDSSADSFKNVDKDLYASDELSFDKQTVAQKIDSSQLNTDSAIGGFLLSLLTQGFSALSSTASDVMVNAIQGTNSNDADSAARKYSQFFLANTMSAATTDINAYTFSPTISSEVVALKTLDMFYSTSSDAKCAAGPGFVNHNFVAQCIAQGVSNRYIQADQNSMFTVLAPLSILELKLKTKLLEMADDLIESGLDFGHDASLPTAMGSGGGSFVASIVAVVGTALRSIAKTIIETNNFFIEMLPSIIGCFKISDGASFSKIGAINEHRIDIEGKHRYGAKNVSFMWPCFGAYNTTYTNEKVKTVVEETSTDLDFSAKSLFPGVLGGGEVPLVSAKIGNVTSSKNDKFKKALTGTLYSSYTYCKGTSAITNTPDDMAVIEGVDTFLPAISFKNENISVGEPVFTQPFAHDYMLDNAFGLSVTAIDGNILWVSCKDTKLIDGAPSNMFISGSDCFIASSYGVFEVKKEITKDFLRPYAVTPNTIALNVTGINMIHDNKVYHGFDGVSNRFVEWHGASGMDKQSLVQEYCFQINDHFKRSNILPPAQFFGNFTSVPSVSVKSRDKIYNNYMSLDRGVSYVENIAGENRNVTRYSIPVFSEWISTLPAVVKTLSSYKLNVVEGVTSTTTDLRGTQTAYKAPKSVDFAINGKLFRSTDEFVCTLNNMNGTVSVQDIVATMGLTYIGSTPMQAFFYSAATRAYYTFIGNTSITKTDVWSRFRDVTTGHWDFVNQEVVFDCLATLTRIDKQVIDDEDETDNIFICRLDGSGIKGEVTPPITTIFNDRSWFKILSMPGGLCFQGPKRFIVNRFVVLDHMLNDIIANKGKWKKLDREIFHPVRDYGAEYVSFNDDNTYDVRGWTHNPFVFVTSPLGIDEDTDCMFEWEITFTWTEEMDKLYGPKDYMCINISAQTMCPGGKLVSRPTHLLLTKEMFTRAENSGYYSFRFNSNNGAGNREQLFVWSDSYIVMTGCRAEYKVITTKRNTQLTQQVDVQGLTEM